MEVLPELTPDRLLLKRPCQDKTLSGLVLQGLSRSAQQGVCERLAVGDQPGLHAVPAFPATALGRRLDVDRVTVGHTVGDEVPAGLGGLFDDTGQLGAFPPGEAVAVGEDPQPCGCVQTWG